MRIVIAHNHLADTGVMREPIFHSGITDELPEDHPLAWQSVYCVVCRAMLHGLPNENMDAWMETGRGAYCLNCFAHDYAEVEPEAWALHSDEAERE